MTQIREIVFDTETTGIDPLKGDRVLEIGCLELINHLPTGRTLHLYINPERDVPAEAVAVHGLTAEFLSDKPIFSEVADAFLDFIADDILIAHNADFDVMFMNAELTRLGFPRLEKRRVRDTLAIARQKFPGSPASLDALCKRFNIDNSGRTLHGALLDSQLLAEVYLELLGGRQITLDLSAQNAAQSNETKTVAAPRKMREPRSFPVCESELAAHATMLEKIKDALWLKVPE